MQAAAPPPAPTQAPRPAAQPTSLPADATMMGSAPLPPPPPRPPEARARRRPRARTAARAVVSVLLLAGVVAGLHALSRQVYFVATNDGGLVTLYRGVPYELPFGIDLYEPGPRAACPRGPFPRLAGDVLDHSWRSKEDAVDLVRALERGRSTPAGAVDDGALARAVRAPARVPARGGRVRCGAGHAQRT